AVEVIGVKEPEGRAGAAHAETRSRGIVRQPGAHRGPVGGAGAQGAVSDPAACLAVPEDHLILAVSGRDPADEPLTLPAALHAQRTERVCVADLRSDLLEAQSLPPEEADGSVGARRDDLIV